MRDQNWTFKKLRDQNQIYPIFEGQKYEIPWILPSVRLWGWLLNWCYVKVIYLHNNISDRRNWICIIIQCFLNKKITKLILKWQQNNIKGQATPIWHEQNFGGNGEIKVAKNNMFERPFS